MSAPAGKIPGSSFTVLAKEKTKPLGVAFEARAGRIVVKAVSAGSEAADFEELVPGVALCSVRAPAPSGEAAVDTVDDVDSIHRRISDAKVKTALDSLGPDSVQGMSLASFIKLFNMVRKHRPLELEFEVPQKPQVSRLLLATTPPPVQSSSGGSPKVSGHSLDAPWVPVSCAPWPRLGCVCSADCGGGSF